MINLPDMKEVTSEMNMIVGKNIKKYRIQQGLSRQQLSGFLGVTHQQVQKYETGDNRTSAGQLYLIAKALKVNISAFFDDNENNTEDLSCRLAISAMSSFAKLTPKQQKSFSDLMRVVGEK